MKNHMGNNHLHNKILTFNPSGEFYFLRGIEAFQKNNLALSKKYLTRAWQFEPNEPVIACQLAIVHSELGEYDRSNEILYKVLHEIEPYMYDCHYFLANNYAYIGMYNEAVEHANMYLKLMPNGEYADDVRELLEIISFEADDLKTSILTMDEPYEEEIITRQEQAKKLLEQGKFDDAIERFNDMIVDFPDYWPAYNNLALAHFYKGEKEEALKIVAKVLDENPGNLHALCNLTVFYYYEGKDYKPLLNSLKKIFPISADHRFKLAVTFVILKQYEEAYAWLKKMLIHDQIDLSFYYWFAYAAYFVGKEQLAEKAWKKLMLVQPEKEGMEPWKHS